MKRVLIIYAKNQAEVLNRKSALGSYIHALANALQKSNWQVSINGVEFLQLTHPSAKPVPGKHNFAKKFISVFTPKVIKSYLRDRAVLKQIASLKEALLKDAPAADCILEFYSFGSDVGAGLAASKGIPLYVIYDAPILEEYKFFHGVTSPWKNKIQHNEQETLRQANSIVVYSNPVKNYVGKIYPELKANFQVHQNIDFSRFHVLDREFVKDSTQVNICFIGSFLKWHRVDQLIGSFSKLTQEHPLEKFMLYLVGDGMERKKCENLVKRLNLTNVLFTGFLDGDQLIALQKKMHIGIMPGSNWYGAPNKLFEYGAMKMAVVSPKTPTICDIFKESEVSFFENGNADDLYDKLREICLNKSYREQLSEELYNAVTSRFSEEKTYQFYSNLLSGQSTKIT